MIKKIEDVLNKPIWMYINYKNNVKKFDKVIIMVNKVYDIKVKIT